MGSECLSKPGCTRQTTLEVTGNHLLPNLLEWGLQTLKHDCLEEPLGKAVSSEGMKTCMP